MKADVWSFFCPSNSKTHNAPWKTPALKLENKLSIGCPSLSALNLNSHQGVEN